MNRYTRKDAEVAFVRFIEGLGLSVAKSYNDVGGFLLDYNPTYGGCQIQQVMSEGGGVSTPFGSRRRAPREFCETTWFALAAVNAADDGR